MIKINKVKQKNLHCLNFKSKIFDMDTTFKIRGERLGIG